LYEERGFKMILTDYYKFEHLQGTKSKSRLDCTASTGSYTELEILRNKKGYLFVYVTDVPDSFGGRLKRKADKAITKTKNISSVYVPDIENNLAYGDIRGTQDAILIVKTIDYKFMEIFVARGQKNNRVQLYNLFSDGELNEDVRELRKQSITDLVIGK